MPQHQLVAKSTPTHKFISFIPRGQISGSWGSLVPNQSQEIAQNTPITATFYLALYSMIKIKGGVVVSLSRGRSVMLIGNRDKQNARGNLDCFFALMGAPRGSTCVINGPLVLMRWRGGSS